MSIANELSGEVAVAILSLKDKSPQELNRLKKIVVDVRTALKGLERWDRNRRFLKAVERARRANQGAGFHH